MSGSRRSKVKRRAGKLSWRRQLPSPPRWGGTGSSACPSRKARGAWPATALSRFGTGTRTRGIRPDCGQPTGDSLEYVNAPQTNAEAEALRACIRRKPPYGDDAWVEGVARQL